MAHIKKVFKNLWRGWMDDLPLFLSSHRYSPRLCCHFLLPSPPLTLDLHWPCSWSPLRSPGPPSFPDALQVPPHQFQKRKLYMSLFVLPKARTSVTCSSSKAPIIKLAAYRSLHDNLEENGVNGSYTLHGVNSKSNVQPQSLMLNTHQSFLIHGTFLFAGSS